MSYQPRDHRSNPCFGTLRSLVLFVESQGQCEDEKLILDPSIKDYVIVAGTAATRELAEAHYAPCKKEFRRRLNYFFDQMMSFFESNGITAWRNALLVNDEMDLPRESIGAFNRLRDWVFTWADNRDKYHKGGVYICTSGHWRCNDQRCSFH